MKRSKLIPIVIVIALAIVYFLFSQSASASTTSDGTPDYVDAANSPNNISQSDIVTYALAAGFSTDEANTAAAIAMAESGGNANAYNPETAAGAPVGLGSVGLWQIYQNAHPEFAGMNLNDPQTNANAAFSIYSAGDFSAWTTYQNGSYEEFLAA